MALDLKHLESIRIVIAALAPYEPDLRRAMLACEDAYVALGMALTCGLRDTAHAAMNVERLNTDEGAAALANEQHRH